VAVALPLQLTTVLLKCQIILSHFWDDMAMVNYKSEKINAYNGVKVCLRQEQVVKTG
jgi:hypothetical protein